MTPAQHEALQRFGVAARDPLDLGEAALSLALPEEPDLDLDAWCARLDELGAALRERLGDEADPQRRLEILQGYVFGELGMLGNEREYYDPRNSYLHQVIQRGLGIPISLSVLTLEIGRRAGLELFGVSFPAHFLLGTPEGVYLDAFHQGRLLDRQGTVELLHELSGGALGFNDDMLAPCPPRAILQRMLRNLKSSHLRRGEFDLALLDVDRLLVIEETPSERRDHGLIQLVRGKVSEGIADLERYLQTDPPDAHLIKEKVEEARRGL